MKRSLLRLFPRQWRERYGDDFLDHFVFVADGRPAAKWVDALVTAAGLRWRAFSRNGDAMVVALAGALAAVAGCDLALGVGMDERIDSHLMHHWWGAPFVAVLAASAAAAAVTLAAILRDRRRRRAAWGLTAGAITGAVAGSALAAAVSLRFAGVGGGIGVTVAMVTGRVLLRTPPGRADAALIVSVPLIVALGWRTASSPAGPLALLVVAGALVAGRAGIDRPRAPA